jgi:hypothetical protein
LLTASAGPKLARPFWTAPLSSDPPGLTNGVKYCYKVTSYYATCESAYSNVLCATPNAVGQLKVGAAEVRTGKWVTTGKGKNATTTFEYVTSFAPGDEIVFRVKIVDVATSLTVTGATADLTISGPETVGLTTGPSDSAGIAEAVWKTTAPGKKGAGGTTTGAYTRWTSLRPRATTGTACRRP